jgi:hypothetical protein
MLSASRLACRTACWAFGAVVAAGSSFVTSGTAARSPADQAPGMPRTWSVASHSTRPRPSMGRSVSASNGFGLVPAVHTNVSLGNSSPSLSRTTPSAETDSSRVLSRTSMPRAVSCFTVQAAMSRSTSGRIRPVASTSTQRMSAGDSRG